jgi:hypothetical protein
MHLESRSLAANTINQHLAVVRRLAYEADDAGLLSPDLAAGIGRVKGVKQLGQRSGNWLTLAQSSEVLNHARGDSLPSETVPCWPCCWDVGGDDLNWSTWTLTRSKPARVIGPLST